MLFGISLEGRDDGGRSGKQKQSFQVFGRYFPSFFLKGFLFRRKEWDDGYRKGVLIRICQKDGIQVGGNLYKSSHDCSLNEERKLNFFFPQEQIIRTHHVSCKEVFC